MRQDGAIGRPALSLPTCDHSTLRCQHPDSHRRVLACVAVRRACYQLVRIADQACKRVRAQGLRQPKSAIGRLRKISIPLPPLAEQHRIVAKVDALMALCDRLEASLTATAATRRRLLDALLAEALAPADDRELEAAE